MQSSNSNFNSIKVQLILTSIYQSTIFGIFQFHKGTINTFRRNLTHHSNCYFNSIKVQLILADFVLRLVRLHQFQFHKGTINTV